MTKEQMISVIQKLAVAKFQRKLTKNFLRKFSPRQLYGFWNALDSNRLPKALQEKKITPPVPRPKAKLEDYWWTKY